MAFAVTGMILFSLPVATALQWTSSVDLPDNTTVTACVGENATLAWNYQTDAAEHVLDTEWLFHPEGRSEPMAIASNGRGGFIVAPSSTQQVQFLDNAGLHVTHVTTQDSGMYTVNAVVNLHGAVTVYSQRATLLVSDAPRVTGESVHVRLLPRAVQNNVTAEWNVQLACGHFSSLGEPPVPVLWTTPENRTLSSTYYDNGNYILVLDNPVVSGEYTCQLLHTPSSMCLSPDSPLLQAALLTVDGVDARFSVLEGQLHALQVENSQFRQHHNISTSVLEQQLHVLQAENAQLRQDHNISTSALEEQLHILQAENSQLLTKTSQLETENAQLRAERHNDTMALEARLEAVERETSQLRDENANLNKLIFDILQLPSCQEIHQYDKTSGVHTLHINGTSNTVRVFCDQDTAGGGWTVIQRRQDGSVDFYRGWTDYVNGFGNVSGEHWLGLENIYRLTNSGNYSLRVDLEDWDGSTAYAVYDSFRIEDAADNYRLRISGYNGTAGDGMIANHNINNQQFSTHDRDHDSYMMTNCASDYHGAWWYNFCMSSCLNGRYYTDPNARQFDGVYWYPWHKDKRSYKRAEMKLRPRA